MLDDIIFDNLDSFDDIDTSDVENLEDDYSDETTDFNNSLATAEDLKIDDDYKFNGFVTECQVNDHIEDIKLSPPHEPRKITPISFGLGCHCIVHGCGCRAFEGKFGCVCTNCGHGYDKHF